jgi:hypothetical protein
MGTSSGIPGLGGTGDELSSMRTKVKDFQYKGNEEAP